MNLWNDMIARLWRNRLWVAAQFGLTLGLLLVGLAWTRLPDKHVWQVVITILLPLFLLLCVLELEAGTMRGLFDDDGKRVKLVWGACTLLVWVALFCALWAMLDWCDGMIPIWAGYLNANSPAGMRAKVFTYEHFDRWLHLAEWLFRWVLIPAKLIPWAASSAQWGWRLPMRRILRLLWNWRWWGGVLVAALLGEALPASFFTGAPSGSVTAQVLREVLKVVAGYLFAVAGWVLILAWAATLFPLEELEPGKIEPDWEMFRRLRESRKWIAALFALLVLFVLDDVFLVPLLPDKDWIKLPAALVLLAVALVLQAGTIRSLMAGAGKRVRMIWSVLVVAVWGLVILGVLFLADLFDVPAIERAPVWVVGPALLLPLAAVSVLRGFRLPMRPVFRVVQNWKWWLGVLFAAFTGVGLPTLIDASTWYLGTDVPRLTMFLRESADGLLRVGSWVLLLAWLSALYNGQQTPPGEESLAVVPALEGPPEGELSAAAEAPDNEGEKE